MSNSQTNLLILTVCCIFALVNTCALASEKSENTSQKKTINVTNKKSKDAQRQRANQPTKRKKSISSIDMGRNLYKQYQCFDCHNIAGIGCKDGMRLDGIGSKRTKEFIREHIIDPDKHFDKHPGAFQTDLNLMPPQQLEPAEIANLVDYLFSLK